MQSIENAVYKEMVEEFQCPGCAVGGPGICEEFTEWGHGHSCSAHACGTAVGFGAGITPIALGLPKGFNRPTVCTDKKTVHKKLFVRFWDKGDYPDWDKFNVPVWAMQREGYLFVRTYITRLGKTCVDVIRKGTLILVPNAIDVAEFYDEID